MNYYLGIDGGGTKTAFCLFDEDGVSRASLETDGTSYKHVGWEAMIHTISQGVEKIMESADCRGEKVSICFGAPNYGESRKNDSRMEEELKKILSGYSLYIVNDSEVGWAGSLGLKPGINIVAGTGSIAFGKNEAGKSGSSGGWSDFFGDEGSCRWIGVKAMEYFSKQADGRLSRGPLYELMIKEFQVEDPVDAIDIFEEEYQPFRNKLASLQVVALEAAIQGDEDALSIYRWAAGELAMIILSLYKKLEFAGRCQVSYSGGLFRTGDIILQPLKKELSKYDIELVPPLYEPVAGAALIAAQKTGKKLEIKGGTSCILQNRK